MSLFTARSRAMLPFVRPGRRLPAAGGLLLGLCLAGAAAQAAETAKPAPRPAAAKRASQAPEPAPRPIEPVLTRDELRACMTLQAGNRERAADVKRLQPEISAEKAELQRSGEAMKAELAGLDRSDAQAVQSYNERAAARDGQIAQLEAKINDFNAKLTAFETGRQAYGRDCENRKYDERDEKALLGQ